MDYQQALSTIEKHKVIAILRGVPLEDTMEAARTLYRGGIRLIMICRIVWKKTLSRRVCPANFSLC